MRTTPLASLLATLLALVIAFPATAQKPGGSRNGNLQNGGFENGRVGQRPPGWVITGAARQVAGTVTDATPQQGKQCLQLRTRGFGNALQQLHGKPFLGEHVRFRASVRYEGRGRAQLWMRVDRAGKRRGFFDNMADRPITGEEWRRFEIIGKVDDDAVGVTVGLMVIGGGTAWLDDATLEVIDAKDVPRVEPPRKMSDVGLENVIAFVRLLGYVRYFHPSDQAQDVDWDSFAVRGIRAVESAGSGRILAQELQSLFTPIAPTVRVAHGKQPELPDMLRQRPKGARLVGREEGRG